MKTCIFVITVVALSTSILSAGERPLLQEIQAAREAFREEVMTMAPEGRSTSKDLVEGYQPIVQKLFDEASDAGLDSLTILELGELCTACEESRQPELADQLSSVGVERFPDAVEFPLLLIRNRLNSGELEQAIHLTTVHDKKFNSDSDFRSVHALLASFLHRADRHVESTQHWYKYLLHSIDRMPNARTASIRFCRFLSAWEAAARTTQSPAERQISLVRLQQAIDETVRFDDIQKFDPDKQFSLLAGKQEATNRIRVAQNQEVRIVEWLEFIADADIELQHKMAEYKRAARFLQRVPATLISTSQNQKLQEVSQALSLPQLQRVLQQEIAMIRRCHNIRGLPFKHLQHDMSDDLPKIVLIWCDQSHPPSEVDNCLARIPRELQSSVTGICNASDALDQLAAQLVKSEGRRRHAVRILPLDLPDMYQFSDRILCLQLDARGSVLSADRITEISVLEQVLDDLKQKAVKPTHLAKE